MTSYEKRHPVTADKSYAAAWIDDLERKSDCYCDYVNLYLDGELDWRDYFNRKPSPEFFRWANYFAQLVSETRTF